ncbi:hypothetical protein ACHWQZ_G014581 [Mnemiopsis leidyi]
MSIAIANLRHVFGLKGDVANNVAFQDEQTIIYPSGSNCILYNIETKMQKFISSIEKSGGMTAMALTPNKRYIAVAEKGEKATITIYDLQTLRKKKVLTTTEVQSQQYVSLAFSPDSKYLVSQGARPDWTLLYWAWEKPNKPMASIRTSTNVSNEVYQVSFNPNDNAQFCVVGNGVFKTFKYNEGNLKANPIQKIEPQNFLCHSWLSEDRIIVGTDTGRMLLFEGQEHKKDFHVSSPVAPDSTGGERSGTAGQSETSESGMRSQTPVLCVTKYSKGFLCSAGNGIVYMYEKTDERELYKKAREIRIPISADSAQATANMKGALHEIMHMTISPSEETIIATSRNNQLYTIGLTGAEISKGEQSLFETLSQPFHYDQITGLDVCIRKPLVSTCSLDRTVRIWNYENNSLDLTKEFQEEAFSVALHPSGLYVLVGFSDKLRLMNILIDDIQPFKEFTIRGCRECQFSNGGHLFAAVHGNVIQLYATYTFENVGNLKGHNGKVRSIVWSQDDSKIISCGVDGAVYEWSVYTSKREGESVLKTCSYTCAAVSPEGGTTFAVGSDKTLKEISDSQIQREVPAADTVLTQVAISRSGRMLFVGTAQGSIRAMKFPLTVPGEWTEHQCHASSITKMRISYDDSFLFTVGEDACLYTFKIMDKEGRGLKAKDITYAEEILISKSDLQEKDTAMKELKTRVYELNMENEYQLRLKDMNHHEKTKELTEKFIQEMESLKTKNQVLKTDKDKEEAKHEEERQELIERQHLELRDLESANNQKLMAEYEKYQELQAKSQRMQEEYERQLAAKSESHKQALREQTEQYETKLHEKIGQLEAAHDEMRQTMRIHEETKKQIEEDADREILDIKNMYERRLREEKEGNMRLTGETGIMKKKFKSQEQEIEALKSDINNLNTEKNKLNGVIKSLEKDILGLKKEIQERDETIQDKEKRIYDLKKKNQELEKFKFVLDYKIRELKKQIEPRENDIKAMKDQIQEMDTELERYNKNNTALDLKIEESKQKLKANKEEMAVQRQKVHDMEAELKRFRTDVSNCVQYIQDPQKLKTKIVELNKKYVQSEQAVEAAGMDVDIQKEYARQRDHLERSVASFRKKLTKDQQIHRADNVRIMQENVSLIKEINDLRRELKIARTQVHDLEANSNVLKKGAPPIGPIVAPEELDQTKKIVEIQKSEIKRLRDELRHTLNRPLSNGQRLPPLEVAQ